MMVEGQQTGHLGDRLEAAWGGGLRGEARRFGREGTCMQLCRACTATAARAGRGGALWEQVSVLGGLWKPVLARHLGDLGPLALRVVVWQRALWDRTLVALLRVAG